MAANKSTIEVVKAALANDPQVSKTKSNVILSELTGRIEFEPCSESDVAEILGVSRATINSWRNGKFKLHGMPFCLSVAPKPFARSNEVVYNKLEVLRLQKKLYAVFFKAPQNESPSDENTPNA